MQILATVINISASNEIVIDKGSEHGVYEGSKLNIYSPSLYGIFKAQGEVLIVHRKVSVIRSDKDDFSNILVGDLVRDHI